MPTNNVFTHFPFLKPELTLTVFESPHWLVLTSKDKCLVTCRDHGLIWSCVSLCTSEWSSKMCGKNHRLTYLITYIYVCVNKNIYIPTSLHRITSIDIPLRSKFVYIYCIHNMFSIGEWWVTSKLIRQCPNSCNKTMEGFPTRSPFQVTWPNVTIIHHYITQTHTALVDVQQSTRIMHLTKKM